MEVGVRSLVEVVAVITASVKLLAALDICTDTSVVLSLAGVGTSAGLLVAAIRRARIGVGIGVKLERVLRKVALQVVTGNKRQLNTTDRVAGTVAPDVGAGLLANVGGLRSTRGDSSRRNGGSAGDGAGIDAGGSRGTVSASGSVVLDAAKLVAATTTGAGRSTIALNTITPLREVEAVQSAGPASVLEASSNVLGAVVVGGLATVLILEVRDRRRTPVTTLVLAGVGHDNGGSTHSRTSSGAAGRSGCSGRLVGGRLAITVGGRRVGGARRFVGGGRRTRGTRGARRARRTRRLTRGRRLSISSSASQSAQGCGRAGDTRSGANDRNSG